MIIVNSHFAYGVGVTLISTLLALPLGVACAIYLNEYTTDTVFTP